MSNCFAKKFPFKMGMGLTLPQGKTINIKDEVTYYMNRQYWILCLALQYEHPFMMYSSFETPGLKLIHSSIGTLYE